jgi:glyceraldehyde 3-phosphate dehydrogenase
MSCRVGINGFGRIGRSFVRCVVERGLLDDGLELVAINDVWDVPTLAHLLANDSVFGRMRATIDTDGDAIVVDGHRIVVSRQRDTARLDWGSYATDLVIESTGKFRTRDDAAAHLKAGARRVLISAPGNAVDATLVPGVNADWFDPVRHEIVSAASCTTNCVAPMVSVLHQAFGVERGFLTTVHAYTNDQQLIDAPHKDARRARAAAVNIIPTSTGAASAIGEVLPELAGKLDGIAIRVPVDDGSLCDLTCQLTTAATTADINAAYAAAAVGPLAGILRFSLAPIVSRDIIGDPASCVFDGALTQASGAFAKVFGWYDNEWGYTNRLVDLTMQFAERG